MFKRLFILNIDSSRSWIRVILWWELRRILYNFLLLVFGIISLTILSFIVKDLWSFFSPPIMFLLTIGSFAVVANVFYTSGWIFQLITRNSAGKFITRIRPRLFIYGILFSFTIELVPCFVTAGYTLMTGERIKSQYADFATEEPKFTDIAGEYVIAEATKKQLNLPDSVLAKSIIRFNSDSTFEFRYFPHHEFGMELIDFELVNASGTWEIEKNQGSWVIPMHFKSIEDIRTGEIEHAGYFNSNGFNINKDNPPYEIYIIVGDPDSW